MKTFKKVFPYFYGALLGFVIVLNWWRGDFGGVCGYSVALVWFLLRNGYVGLLEQSHEVLDSMFKLNDALFEELKEAKKSK